MITIAEVIEQCAQEVEPRVPRPCDCEKGCDHYENCGWLKVSAVEDWDTKTEAANAIRALKGTIAGIVCESEAYRFVYDGNQHIADDGKVLNSFSLHRAKQKTTK
jgi:hypothetical protein